MPRPSTAYTAYFNRRHRRSGPLLQGRHTAILVEADPHLAEISPYLVTVTSIKTARSRQ